MFWYVIFCFIALIVLYPFCRCLVKRTVCFYRVKKACREMEYRMYPTHPLWFMGSKYSKKCDLVIETDRELLSVKLFGMTRHHSVLVLMNGGSYCVRSFFPMFYLHFPIESRHRKLPMYDFEYEIGDIGKDKRLTRVLLINPVGMELRYRVKTESEKVIGDGDLVNGIMICSLPRLLRRLENGI